MRILNCLLVGVILVFFLPIALAATCGDGNAQGNEQCDGSDFRDFACNTICGMDGDHPSDRIPGDPVSNLGDFNCYTSGTLTCDSNCRISTSSCYDNVCGDGQLLGLEECDDGTDNSDTRADACRTDCTLPSCGDGVTDAGEACDDGTGNSDVIPGACREDCSAADCGDGVIDPSIGEECDDTSDECTRCFRCVEPVDDLVVTYKTKLCPGSYQIQDNGADGVIIVSDYAELDCNGAYIVGVPVPLDQYNQPEFQQEMLSFTGNAVGGQAQPGVQAQQQVQAQTQAQNQGGGGFFAGIVHAIASVFGGGESEPPIVAPAGATYIPRTGVGIEVGEHAFVHGCHVENYKYGIRVTGEDDALVWNTACGNTHDIAGDGHGVVNTCNTGNWNDEQYEHCMYTCDGDTRDEEVCDPTLSDIAPECPECDCDNETDGTTITPGWVVCPDGTKARSWDDCEECDEDQVRCSDGTCADRPTDCLTPHCEGYRCDDGRCVESERECRKLACVGYVCEDGTCVREESDCPEYCDGYTCPDGSCVRSPSLCLTPVCDVRCDDGRCVREEWECDPYECPDGSLVEDAQHCVYCLRGLHMCEDGTCVEEKWMCDPVVCEDGTEVEYISDCPEYCPNVKCSDGSCVKLESDCSVCCAVTMKSATGASSTSYEMMSAPACEERGGSEVEDSYCETGCAPGFVKCSDGTCKESCAQVINPIINNNIQIK